MKPKITYCTRRCKWTVQIKDVFTYFDTYQEAMAYAKSKAPVTTSG